jgi:hypothetical protein
MDVTLDGVDILLLLLNWVGVVEAQVTAAAVLLRYTKIQTDRFGVPDMEIAVRLGRKTGHHLRSAPGLQISIDDVADEIATRFHRRVVPHYLSRCRRCSNVANIPRRQARS